MKVHEYGEWTEVWRHESFLRPEWVAGHIEPDPEVYKGYHWHTNGYFKQKFGDTPRVIMPEFEMVSNPTIRIRDVKQRRFDVLGRYAKIQNSNSDKQSD